MKISVFAIISFVLLYSCNNNNSSNLDAQQIIDKTIENAGGSKYEKAEISFQFREGRYKSKRNGGIFQLEREITDSTGTLYRDILDNQGFTRYHLEEAVEVSDSMKLAYSNSVNSVHYFVQLPNGLNAEAARKKLLGKDSIEGEEYFEMEVTFNEEGGGADHEDEYLYWINTTDFTVDYLAYNFEVDGGGIRFRKAYNPRRVGGIRFVDYENYKYEDLSIPLHKLDSLFEAGKLSLISKIETEEIEVNLLK